MGRLELAVANLKAEQKASIIKPSQWLADFATEIQPRKISLGQIIVCPPFPFLKDWQDAIKSSGLPIVLGAQDVSIRPPGKFTGEVTAEMLRGLGVQSVIIAHSERRALGETLAIFRKKVERVLMTGLDLIYCIPNPRAIIPQGVTTIAYEPIDKIGGSTPDDPETVEKIAASLQKRTGARILYGGGVKPDNIGRFKLPHVRGFIVGGSSLEGKEFGQLVRNAP